MQGPVLILGASGGIGQAVARRLAQDGPVLLHGRAGSDRLAALAAEIAAAGGRCSTHLADLADPAAVREMFAAIAAAHQSLSGLVFAVARPFPHKLAHNTPWAVFQEQVDSQLKALHLSLQAAFGLLKAAAGARVLVVGTEFTLGAPPVKVAPYVAAKAALTAYARVLAREWLKYGVRVHILAPGMVRSGLTADMPEEYLEQVAAGLPEKRLTSGKDVADIAALLMRPEADVLYGTVIHASRGERV